MCPPTRTSTHEVLPPYRRFSDWGVGVEPRTPQNLTSIRAHLWQSAPAGPGANFLFPYILKEIIEICRSIVHWKPVQPMFRLLRITNDIHGAGQRVHCLSPAFPLIHEDKLPCCFLITKNFPALPVKPR